MSVEGPLESSLRGSIGPLVPEGYGPQIIPMPDNLDGYATSIMSMPLTMDRELMEMEVTETEMGNETVDTLAHAASALLLFLLIFGMSATVDINHLKEQMNNKFAILIGVSTQFILMPLLGFLAVLAMGDAGLTDPMAITLLIVMASPGGSYSNWWCSMFNADLALSVTMTAFSTILSTVMLPANLLLYVNAAFGFGNAPDVDQPGILGDINWGSLFISLAIVIAAISTGLLASAKVSNHRFNRVANKVGSISGILLIVLSAVLSSMSGGENAQIWQQPWSFYVGVTMPCMVGLIIATTLAASAGLKKPEVVSVGVECCYQNVGIATSAAVAMFDDPVERGQALCVPLFYGLMEAVLLGIYCIFAWKLGWTKAPANEKFCLTIVNTYEVDDDEDEGAEDEFQNDAEVPTQVSAENPNAPPSSPARSPVSPSNYSVSTETWNESPADQLPHEEWTGIWSFLNVFNPRRTHSETENEAQQSPSVTVTSRRPSQIDNTTAAILQIATQSVSASMDALEDKFGSPSSLVAMKNEEGEYTRCRMYSEDSANGTAITSQTSSVAGSTTSLRVTSTGEENSGSLPPSDGGRPVVIRRSSLGRSLGSGNF